MRQLAFTLTNVYTHHIKTERENCRNNNFSLLNVVILHPGGREAGIYSVLLFSKGSLIFTRTCLNPLSCEKMDYPVLCFRCNIPQYIGGDVSLLFIISLLVLLKMTRSSGHQLFIILWALGSRHSTLNIKPFITSSPVPVSHLSKLYSSWYLYISVFSFSIENTELPKIPNYAM